MDILGKYKIAHKGLSIGSHEFSFTIDDRFFSAFEGSEIQKGVAEITVNLEKQSSLVVLNFKIEGNVTVACDRCLDELELPLECQSTLFVRFADTEDEYDGETMWLSSSETEIPLAQYIYETIILGLPYQRVHPENENGQSGCNKDMLTRFKIIAPEEFEAMVEGKPSEAKSPWAKLEELKTKLEK